MSKGKSKLSYSYSVWFFLVLRLILVFVPQTGYVSPREVCPDFGIFAAKKFNFETNFKPIRSYGVEDKQTISVIVGYLFYGWSYDLLWLIDACALKTFHISVITPITLLITPRIAMCLLSYLIDYALYKICLLSGDKSQTKSLILASSHCMLIYSSRSLVNTQETILLALLLYFVVQSTNSTNIGANNRSENILKRFSSTSSTSTKKIIMQRLKPVDKPYRNVLAISVIFVLGFFTRPIFLLYSGIPILFWLCRGLGRKQYFGCYKFLKRCLVLSGAVISMTVLMIAADSIFYGLSSIEEMIRMDLSQLKIIVTPVNQLIMIQNEDRVDTNVSWDWNLGVLVGQNLLLFHILGVYTCLGYIGFIKTWLSRKAQLVETTQYLMNMSSILSISLMTMTLKPITLNFLPFITPFVFLSGDYIFSANGKRHEVKTTESNLKVKEHSSKRIIFKLWICINIVLGLFNGFVYQGGVLPAAMYLSKEYEANPVDVHIVTSHVYPVPQILFMQREHEQEIFLREYDDVPIKTVIERINTLRYEAYVSGNEYRIYFLIPADKHREVIATLQDFTRVRIKLEKSFYPHFNVEALPAIDMDTLKTMSDEIFNFEFSNATALIHATFLTFHLNLYSVNP